MIRKYCVVVQDYGYSSVRLKAGIVALLNGVGGRLIMGRVEWRGSFEYVFFPWWFDSFCVDLDREARLTVAMMIQCLEGT
jgi:hypothetical protein